MSEGALSPVNEQPLGQFSADDVTWLSWLPSSPDEDSVDWVGLFGPGRAKSPAFKISAQDVGVGLGISGIEDSIFNKAQGGGLPRIYRELGALTASRVNGCLFCVAHHAIGAVKFRGDPEAVQRILDEGVESAQSPEWRLVIDASVALTRVPIEFGAEHVESLRAAGFDDGMILDLVHSVGYFNSANRFLLSLGETTRAPV